MCRYSDSENGKRFLGMKTELMELLGGFSIGEFVPWLRWTSRVNGYDKRVERVAKEMDDVLEGVIQEHVESKNRWRDRSAERNGETFIDTLLEIQNENSVGVSIDRDSIKALILVSTLMCFETLQISF